MKICGDHIEMWSETSWFEGVQLKYFQYHRNELSEQNIRSELVVWSKKFLCRVNMRCGGKI